jgi:hypothetical protein
MKPADVAPGGIVTLAGTERFGLVVERLTVTPAGGACALSSTVQAAGPGAPTLDGEHVSLLSNGAVGTDWLTVIVALVVGPAIISADGPEAWTPLTVNSSAELDPLAMPKVSAAIDPFPMG